MRLRRVHSGNLKRHRAGAARVQRADAAAGVVMTILSKNLM
jgi:hypothetical protein